MVRYAQRDTGGVEPDAANARPQADLAALVAGVRAKLTAPGSRFAVGEEDVRGNRMCVFAHRARSVRELLVGSVRFGDRTYLVDGDVRLTYARHLELVDAFATALARDHGVRPGDRVAIFAANRWEWIVAFWAAVSTGAIPAAFNGWWTPDETVHAVALAEPVLVVGDAPRLARVTEAGIDVATFDLDRLAACAEADVGAQVDVPAVGEDDPAVLIFTSGTTGRPKAVTVPHRSVIGFTQINLFGEAVGRVVAGQPVPRADEQLPVSDDVVLVTSPLFHTSMLQGMVIQAVTKGSRIVLARGRFDPERVLQTIERERVTMWSALGSAAPRVCASAVLGAYDTSSVRQLGIGGAPVSPAVQQQLRETFPSARQSIGMGYTSTEGGAVVANIGGPEYLAHPTSTGRVTVTTELELRDLEGRPVPDGVEGEVHVRSPHVMLGYWRDPAASAAVLKDGGWLAMGDVARLQGGLLYIDSRARDMILVSAENVSPTEVEYCLEEHPAVAEAAVFAVDDEVTGDAVCAVLSVRPDTDVTPSDLTAWCGEHLARYKVPTHWRLIDEPLPRTASGKVVKHQLRAQFDAGALGAPRR